jgi:hypothetical protein
MPVKIIRATDAIKVATLKVLLYGQPGLGKTSLAFTCNAPLCLDFDKGAYRSKQRKDALDIGTWSDVVELMKSPAALAPYQTIIIDTVGRCLDEITRHILAESPKLGNRNGNLSLQGYGELKSIFQSWMRQLTLLGKDVVMICHDKEEKDGDRVFKRPDVVGGSLSEVLKVSDLIGYLSMKNNKAILDFTPTDDYVAKDAARLKSFALPNFDKHPNFGAQMLTKAKEEMSSLSGKVAAAADTIEQWRTAIDGYTTPEECNAGLAQMNNLPPEIGGQVKVLLNNRITVIGVIYNAERAQFERETVKPEPPSPQPAPPQAAVQPLPAAPNKNGAAAFSF